MRFLVDAQLPPALARHLKALGHDAEHVFDIGYVEAPDTDIWTYAISASAVIVSKDDDFAQRGSDPQSPVQVVWIRLGNLTNRALWTALEPRFAEIVEALAAGERLIEVT